jgi:hypothetical protein
MENFEIAFKQKKITRTDWQTAKLYQKLRKMVLRSMSIQDSLHISSLGRIGLVKGITYDSFSSRTLEQLWKYLECYFKNDPLPVIAILDSITGYFYPNLEINLDFIKMALKKFRKILKNLDIVSIFQKIDEDVNQSLFAA